MSDSPQFVYVSDNATLRDAVEQILQKEFVALDTEFIRTNTFYPKPALVQLYDGDNTYLVDPLEVTNFEPLRALFRASATTKVMHSCGEDLEVFSRLLGELPKPLIDTQLAAGLAGYGFSMSYQNIASQLLQRDIAKGETRSDWLRRPLSDRQLHYAVDDVLWLLDIFQALKAKLEEQSRWSWLEEDCADVLARAEQPIGFDEYYRRVKGTRKLDGQALNILRTLCAWREKEARERDLPRGHIVKDTELLSIVTAKPKDKLVLADKSDLSPRTIRKYGDDIVRHVTDGLAAEEQSYPLRQPVADSPDSRADIKKMKRIARSVASRLGVEPEVLARKKDIEEYYFADDKKLTALGRGWRGTLLAEELSAFSAAVRPSSGDDSLQAGSA